MRILVLVGIVALSLLVTLFSLIARHDGAIARAGGGDYRGSEPPARILMPRFLLRDHQGRTLRDDSLRGRVVLLTFLDAQCEETCPVIAAQVAGAFGRMDPSLRSRLTAIAISTDPAEDTPAAVRTFLRRTGAERTLRYLIRPTRTLKRLWREFQILSSLESGKDSLHSAPVRIYDPAGVWVSTLHAGVDLTNENLIHDLRLAEAEGSS